MVSAVHSVQKDLERRIDTIGWGLFFVMSGATLLVPGLPDGAWLTSVGVLLLGLAAWRALLALPVSAFGVVVATVLVVAGVGAMAGFVVPWFALLLILCGLALVAGVVRQPARA